MTVPAALILPAAARRRHRRGAWPATGVLSRPAMQKWLIEAGFAERAPGGTMVPTELGRQIGEALAGLEGG